MKEGGKKESTNVSICFEFESESECEFCGVK